LFPGLTEDQAELFANFLTQLAPKVAPKIVEEISEIVKDIQTEMTDSDIAKLAEMTKQLTHEVTPQQVTNEHRNFLNDKFCKHSKYNYTGFVLQFSMQTLIE
jgi:hypothetical protein